MIYMASPLLLAVGSQFYMEYYIHIFKCACPFDYTFCGRWEGSDPVNRINHTGLVAVVSPTDRPKSVSNRCVIKVSGGVFVLSNWFFFLEFSVGVGAFVIGLSQISSFSSDVLSSIQSSRSCADFLFLYPPAWHVVASDLSCIPDTGLQSLFTKGPKYRLSSRFDFTKCRNTVEEALQTYCKRWCKRNL